MLAGPSLCLRAQVRTASKTSKGFAESAIPGLPPVRIKFVEPHETLRPVFDDASALPRYEPVSLRFRGHDFPVLDRYLSYSRRIAKIMGIKDVKTWATPAKRESVTNYKPRTSIPSSTFDIFTYERNLHLKDANVPSLQSLLAVLETNLPEGVQLTCKLHERADEEIRYIPDYELQALQKELRSLDDPSTRAQLGWNPDVNA